MPDPYNVDVDHTYLRFNPSHHQFHDDICADISAFREYAEKCEHKKPMQVRIFAWVVCMYDLNTPLRREISDLYKRKVYAGTITGLTPHKVSGKYAEWVEQVFTGADKEVNNLIVKYIASFSSPEYKQLVFHERLQQNLLNQIISGKAGRDSQVVFDSSTKTTTELTRALFGSGERDEVAEARRALYKQVALDLSDMRPENVARTMEVDGELPNEWSPYEEGYKPKEIKFVGDNEAIADGSEK